MVTALSALAPLTLPTLDRGRQMPADTNPSGRSARADQNAVSQENNPRGERVVRGEVVTTQVNPNRETNSSQRTLNERSSAFSQPDARRFSMQAALQTFIDNEALTTGSGQARQVSGIIDEYV